MSRAFISIDAKDLAKIRQILIDNEASYYTIGPFRAFCEAEAEFMVEGLFREDEWSKTEISDDVFESVVDALTDRLFRKSERWIDEDRYDMLEEVLEELDINPVD